jgi:mono/diheme cytochrome c family protein
MKPDRKKAKKRNAPEAKTGGSGTPLDPSLSCKVEANEPEPKASAAYPSVGLVTMILVLFYFGQLYLHQHGGGFHAQVYEPFLSYAHVRETGPQSEEELLALRGWNIYSTTCMGCHGISGAGVPPNPPLAGSEWVLTEDPDRGIRVVLHGLTGPIEVMGQPYAGTMVGFGDLFNDEEIAAVLTYVRNEWGNEAPAVSPSQVAAIRQETAGRTAPWTATELDAVSPE